MADKPLNPTPDFSSKSDTPEQKNFEQKANWQFSLFIGGAMEESAQTSHAENLLHELVTRMDQEPLIERLLIQCHKGQDNLALILDAASAHLPDIIVLDAPSLIDLGVDIAEWCRTIRDHCANHFRPVMMVLGGNREPDRIAWMLAGADDVVSDGFSAEELTVRLLIQLRRHLESSAHPVTQLPGLSVCAKILQRRMNRYMAAPQEESPWALLLISLEHFDAYEEQYGHLAANQVLRALSAILLRSVILPDFIGQSDNNDFLILTHPDKATKIATLLARQFEAAVPNFYSDRDRKQGYLTSMPDEAAYRRIPFIKLSIGIVSAKTHHLPTFLSAYQRSGMMRDLARQSPCNDWVSDTPQLAGEKVHISRASFPILVVESDAAMAYLLKTTLQMDAYPVEVTSNADEALAMFAPTREDLKVSDGRSIQAPIRLVILDAVLAKDYLAEEDGRLSPNSASGLQLCRSIKSASPRTAIICISSLHQREMVLRAGADVYLPKPFEIRTLFLWVERLLGI